MTDLDKLIDAVEAGTASTMLFDQVLGGVFCERFGCGASVAEAAYFGSLDTAKALHDALLPGWAWTIQENGEQTVWPPNDIADQEWCADGITVSVEGMDPARAWLLAILRAVKAKG